MTKYIAGYAENLDDQGQPIPGSKQDFEIWDDAPDLLVRLYNNGVLGHEDCLRAGQLTSLDNGSFPSVRIDSKLDPTSLRARALSPFLVPSQVMADLALVGPCVDPTGLEYRGDRTSEIKRVVLDPQSGFLLQIEPATGVDQPITRLRYATVEQVAAAPAPTALEAPYTENYDYDEDRVAAVFGLPALPVIAGLVRRDQMIYTSALSHQAEVWYNDAGERHLSVQWVEQAHLPMDAAFGPEADDYGDIRVRVLEDTSYLEFIAPDLETLRLLAGNFRPGLVI